MENPAIVEPGSTAFVAVGGHPMHPRLKAVWRQAACRGPAYTVQCAPDDNTAIYAAIAAAPPGSILVINAQSPAERGYWGEILTVAAQQRGIAGVVIDGGVRDILALERRQFPIFSQCVALKSSNKGGGGLIGGPVVVGDVPIQVGDWIVADEDGVVVVGAASWAELSVQAREHLATEERVMKDIARGVPVETALGIDISTARTAEIGPAGPDRTPASRDGRLHGVPGGDINARRDKATCFITLANPSRVNAISVAMWRKLRDTLTEADRDPKVRVIIIQGAGTTAFSAGADRSEFGHVRSTPEQAVAYDNLISEALDGLLRSRKPVIAAVDGHCIGAGLLIACAADIRLCTDASSFRYPAARLGLPMTRDKAAVLVGAAGIPVARRLLLTASTLDARAAVRLGLVAESVADRAALDALVGQYADRLADNAPLALASIKLALRGPDGRGLFGWPDEAGLVAACLASDELQSTLAGPANAL